MPWGQTSADPHQQPTTHTPSLGKRPPEWKLPVGGILNLDSLGIVHDSLVKIELCAPIYHGPLKIIHAVVVHQTDSSTAKGTIAGYKTGLKGTGAHFLIDKDGTVYQTVPLTTKCWHVGPIKSRCFETHTCTPDETKMYLSLKTHNAGHSFVMTRHHHEMQKVYPDRYPSNEDSIGIEIVGRSIRLTPEGNEIPSIKVTDYEKLTPEQQRSLNWLIQDLLSTLNLTRVDIYRHPVISSKTKGEASDARF